MTKAEKTIRRESIFLRVLWMLLFLLVWHVAVPLLGILVVAQLLYRLFYGAPSVHFMNFGDSLSQYLAQIGRFAVFNTDAKPWPVADWPQARAADGEAAHVPKNKKTAQTPVSAEAASATVPQPAVATDTGADAPVSADLSEVAQAPESSETPEAPEAPEVPAATSVQSTEEDSAAVDDKQTKDEAKP